MRGSMLAVIAVAIVVGLGVVFAVRTMGLLNPPPPPSPPPVVVETKPVVVVPPPPPPQVLVPIRELYVGDNIAPLDVTIRPLRPEEMKDYEANKDKYMPPTPYVAYFRSPANNIEVDTPLRKDHFAPQKKPEPLHDRLPPGARAVSVAVPKERSASGLIQIGDWVDVYLITDVSRTDNPAPVAHTGLLVPAAQVIAKRDTLFTLFTAPDPGPVSYTLAMNPYRAALLEYGRSVGVLALVPVSATEKARLDKVREAAMADPQGQAPMAVAPDSKEAKDEKERIARYLGGNLTVGTDDLMRVLNLPVIQPPPPPPDPPEVVVQPPAPPPPPPVTVEVYGGVQKTHTAVFPQPAPPQPEPIKVKPPVPPYVPPPPAQYQFRTPSQTGNGPNAAKPVGNGNGKH